MAKPNEKHARAVELHLAGATYQQIADTVGYATRSAAYTAVQKGLKRSGRTTSSTEAVPTELARLDAMLVGVWPRARRGDLGAVDRVLRIEERRSQILLGLDQAAARAKEQTEQRRSGLSEFEKRLAQRQHRAQDPPRAEGG